MVEANIYNNTKQRTEVFSGVPSVISKAILHMAMINQPIKPCVVRHKDPY